MAVVGGPRFALVSTLWNDLLAYYTADNTPNDALGNFNGTLTNGATYGTGIINQGFSLDGVNDYVTMGNVLDFSGDTPFSFSCWINPLGSTTVNILSKFLNGGSYPGYTLLLTTNLVRFIIQINNSTNRLIVTTTSTLNSGMRHITLTYDGSTNASGTKIYVDGVSQSLTVKKDTFTGGLTTGSDFELGGYVIGLGHFDGIIDEVGVWDRELSASEVTELYNVGAGKQYPTGINVLWSDLLAYYTADSTPNDALGNFNGTLLNGATYGTGIISNGFSLDGVNDTVDFGNNLDFDGSTPFSVSCWINANNVTSSNVPLAKAQNLAPFTGYWFLITSTGNLRFILSNDLNSPNWLAIENSTTLSTSTWYHCVMTYDGSKSSTGLKVYVDNALNTQNVISDTLTGSTSNSINFKLGARNNGFFYNGLIDEVAVFNKELTASEVTELYNVGAGKQYPN